MAKVATKWLDAAHAVEQLERPHSPPARKTTVAHLSDRIRPPLSTLRHATRQIALLSQAPDIAPIDGIIVELNRAASAVAHLMGAVGAVDDPLHPPRREAGMAVPEATSEAANPTGAPDWIPCGVLEVDAHD